MGSVFLTAEWRSLVMLNYTIDRAVLTPWLPPGVELDLWQGQAVVSVVGFLFRDCRIFGLAVPAHRHFEEVNLRFYVRRPLETEVRRGVVFVKEIVPRRAIAHIARLFYNERYVALPMRHLIDGARFEFAWRQGGAWQRLAARTRGCAEAMRPGGEEEFIFEHYWGYSRQRDGGTVEYQVEHPPWRVWQTEVAELDCDVPALYGGAFAPALRGAPQSAFVADGSAVRVWRGMRIA